jgi:hypothetical protein
VRATKGYQPEGDLGDAIEQAPSPTTLQAELEALAVQPPSTLAGASFLHSLLLLLRRLGQPHRLSKKMRPKNWATNYLVWGLHQSIVANHFARLVAADLVLR